MVLSLWIVVLALVRRCIIVEVTLGSVFGLVVLLEYLTCVGAGDGEAAQAEGGFEEAHVLWKLEVCRLGWWGMCFGDRWIG